MMKKQVYNIVCVCVYNFLQIVGNKKICKVSVKTYKLQGFCFNKCAYIIYKILEKYFFAILFFKFIPYFCLNSQNS